MTYNPARFSVGRNASGGSAHISPFLSRCSRQHLPHQRTHKNSLVAIHVPVLLRETLHALDLSPGLVVVDATVGGGGHSRRILEHITPNGTLIGLDRDPLMLQHAAAVIAGERSHLCHANYRDLPNVLRELGIPAVDRIVVDLGLSSDQLADRERGFGFATSGPLDMRFDVSQGEPASELL